MPEFQNVLREFAQDIKRNFRSRIAAQPEDQLKPGVQRVLQAAGRKIETRTEVRADVEGRPDIGVASNRLLCGFVELKAPGKGARPQRFTGADKRQWEKFKALPNLIYTDGNEWALYRSGKPWPEEQPAIVRFSGDITAKGADAISDVEAEILHELLIAFFNWQPIVPTRAPQLAEMLAPLCRLAREDVLRAVSNEQSHLAQLAGEWRNYLFPDADNARFADAYAQTLTYALLLARFNGEARLTTDSAARSLDSGHGLLAQTLRVLAQSEARNEIALAVDLLERVIAAVDPGRLTERGDPWLYFYEDFLAAYDPKLRKDQGAYYTPQPVIGVQVRLTAELLESKFHKLRSFADDGVFLLDPAAGTCAYPLAAAEYALRQASARFGAGIIPGAATKCAENIHAFENMVGPYAVAHLRLTQLIASHGGTQPDGGIHVYLTDTLESPNQVPHEVNLFARKLTEEHRRAQRIKKHTRVLVCMGNPPYDREQAEVGERPEHLRKGGWVRHGDPRIPSPDNPSDHTRPILQDFIEPASAAGAGVHVKNLYNDYVYFWRWALWKLFENPEASGPGIITFITAASYLRGPGFVGMRRKMREAFDELWIIDLEGDNLGARKTENVFAIQTPVAIAIGVRYDSRQPENPARVRYAKITGTCEEKYRKLDTIRSFADLEWQDCLNGWSDPFLPRGRGNYYNWPLLTDLLPWQHSGVQFKRTWPIGETSELLRQRWTKLLVARADERGELMRETSARKATNQYESFLPHGGILSAIGSLSANVPPIEPIRYGYRSFDRQWLLPDARLCDRPRPPFWQAHSDQQVYFTALIAGVLGLGPAATISASVPDLHYFCGRGGKDVIPLWRDAEASQANVTGGLLDVLNPRLGNVTPEDFFAYCYALLATPDYVQTYSEELTVPGPRIPLTKDRTLFHQAAQLGCKLIWLHTYGERFVPARQRPGEVPQGSARSRRGVPDTAERYPEDFFYNEAAQVLRVGEGEFGPVSKAVWEFSVSGLQVVRSWLSYRMKGGAGRSSSPLDEIRPQRWTSEMSQELLELLWVLEATVAMFPELKQTLEAVIAGETFRADELPQPTVDERKPPSEEEPPEHEQQDLIRA
ncbi:MAG: type ISP restriction/modification enzyme [Verrucomicrobiota bacterium]